MLTVFEIDAIEPHPTKRVEYFDKDGLFLIVQPQPSGHMSWALRYRTPAGRKRKMTLGVFGKDGDKLTLEAARKKATLARAAIVEGRDPAADKLNEKRDRAAAERKANAERFDIVAEMFLQECLGAPAAGDRKRNPTKHQYKSRRIIEKLIVPEWESRPLAGITKRDCKDLLKRIARKTPTQANRVWATLSKLFRWALEEDLLPIVSPMAGVKRPAEETSCERVLSNSELARIWRACNALDAREAAFVRLAFLTAARRGELLGLMWREIDLDAKTWTMEGSRTKNGKAHVLPLVDGTLRILADLPRIAAPGKAEANLVLTVSGITPLSNLSKLKAKLDAVLAADGGAEVEGWTFHDIRRSVATKLAELGTPPYVIEAVLNHVSGEAKGGIRGVYNRHKYYAEKVVALGDVWAVHLAAILEGREPPGVDYNEAWDKYRAQQKKKARASNVVPMPSSARERFSDNPIGEIRRADGTPLPKRRV